MATRRKEAPTVGAQRVEVVPGPKSGVIAEAGIATAKDFVRLMGAMISDIITGRISPQVGNAAVNAGGKLLKVVELQHRYGKAGNGTARTLNLLEEAE